MVRSAKIYVEGGGDEKELKRRCAEGFHKLLERTGFAGRLPRLVIGGSRNDTFDRFRTAISDGETAYIALLVDSEELVDNVENTWAHVIKHDGWQKPSGSVDEDVLLMTTCMETWIVADPVAISNHFAQHDRKNLTLSGLPKTNLESRHPHDIQDALVAATKNCKAPYAKGKRSFEVLAKLDPEKLKSQLPSFARVVRILDDKL